MKKVWKTKEFCSLPKDLIDSVGSEILAKLLVNRGIDTVQKAECFLNPLKMKVSLPDAFSDMEKAVNRISSAIDAKENITVFGDFDADGITSTSLLYLTLKHLGANVNFYLPNRETESHGLNSKAVVNIIAKQKAKLIITVDCAISNIAEVKLANGLKTDVIITDHHEAPAELPPAFAILNPKAKDSLRSDLPIDEIESLNCLAGVGVAFKLACGLLDSYDKIDFIDELLPLVALGTIADVVPLLGENRCFVSMGLVLIQNGRHEGIKRLLESAGVQNLEAVSSETIAFSVAPRINAAGRLDTAEVAFNLLTSKKTSDIDNCVETLNTLNEQRQELCDSTFEEAVRQIEQNPKQYKHSIILYGEGWHIGVIGIVASKLVEKYNLPTFLLTKDSSETSVIRSSCRSIPQVNIYEVLSVHSELFLGYGGHSMAAGFSFDEKTISFDKFRKILDSTIAETTQGIDLTPVINVDIEILPIDINKELIDEIQKMQPFGAKNEPPVFALKNLQVSQYKMMGQNANHLKLFVVDKSCKSFECVKWNTPDFNVPLNSAIDVAFYPKINNFNGNTSIQLDLKDIHSEYFDNQESSFGDSVSFDYEIIDSRKKTNISTQLVDYIKTSSESIGLFVESKRAKDSLNLPENVIDLTFDRTCIPENIEEIMFFDCPPTLNVYKEIIESGCPSMIHLMNVSESVLSTDEFVKLLSGMVRYSCKNKGGNFDVSQAARFAGVSDDAVELVVSLLADANVIDIESSENVCYKVNFNAAVELSKLKQNDFYKKLDEEIQQVSDFKAKFKKLNVEDLKKILQ